MIEELFINEYQIQRCESVFDAYLLLHLFREDHVGYLQELVPEFSSFVEEIGRDQGAALHFGHSRVGEVDVGSAVGGREEIYLYDCGLHLEFLGMENVEDGEGIMIGGIGDLVDVDVELLVGDHGIVEGESKGMVAVLLEFIVDLLPSDVDVGCLERNEHQGDIALQFEGVLESGGIEEDVELSGRGDVADMDCSSHGHDFLQLGFQKRIGEKQNAQVGEATRVHPNHLILVLHDPLVGTVKSILIDRVVGGSLELHASQAVFPMDVVTDFLFAIDELV